MASTTEDLETLQKSQIYLILDERTLDAYIGQTAASLGRRLNVHFAHAREDPDQSPIAEYLSRVLEEDRREDVTIQALDEFSSEREAIEQTGMDTLINENQGDLAPRESAFDTWDEKAIEILREHSLSPAAEMLQGEGYVASTSVVKDARKQLGLKEQKRLTELQASEAYLLYQATGLFQREVAERYDVSEMTINNLVNARTFEDLDRERLDEIAEEMGEAIKVLQDQFPLS